MNAARQLLDELAGIGASIERAGDRLIVQAGSRDVPAVLVERLSRAKGEVLELITASAAISMPTTWGDDEAERVAIAEYDGGAQHDWAEAFARLYPDQPPADVPRDRWLIFLDDCGRFVDRWAAQAIVLGWTAHDLFGCDRHRPYARLDMAGLLWLVEGREVVALTADTAVIRTRTGARLAYRRRPSESRQVLVWELSP